MRYIVTVDGETYRIEIDGARITIDGESVEASLAGGRNAAVRSLLLDHAAFALMTRPGDTRGQWQIDIDGVRYHAEAVDERTHAIRSMTATSSAQQGPRTVRAPMPGLVVRIEVTAGEEVRAGQGVVIIEAMKMENELRADGGGIVSRVLVEAGQTVEKGTVLIEFEGGA